MASVTTTVPPPPPPGVAGPLQRPRSMQFVSFVAALAWFLCAQTLAASASNGLTQRLNLSDVQPILESFFLLFLVICGLSLLRTIEKRRAPLGLALGLPKRSTVRAEWATGAALGWGLALACVLPMALARALNVQLWAAPRAFLLLALSLTTLTASSLAYALGIYGYGFQRLIDATGPVRATLVMVAISAIYAGFTPTPFGTPDGTRILVAMLMSTLFCLCWLRTHGLWLLWGLRFAWIASVTVLFGLPMGGDGTFASLVDTRAIGPAWLTGGVYGPRAAALSIVFVIAAIRVLVLVTEDYAWNYTHPPIIPAGYDVTVAPPAAHSAMEQAAQAAGPASLVQILPVAPQTPASSDRSSE